MSLLVAMLGVACALGFLVVLFLPTNDILDGDWRAFVRAARRVTKRKV